LRRCRWSGKIESMAATRQIDAPHAATTRRVLAGLEKMSAEAAKDTFVRAGIIDAAGGLTPPYKAPSTPARRKRRSKR